MQEKPKLNFLHRFVPPTDLNNHIVLLLLHGTGGDENDLLPLGRELSPGGALLSPRGKVLENGMARYFRRFGEGVFDLEDLRVRTLELAEFVRDASEVYSLTRHRMVAAGYSNGANIAASLILTKPESLGGAILIRGMMPFVPDRLPNLRGRKVLLLGGRRDAMIISEKVVALHSALREAGAEAELRWVDGGHSLTDEDTSLAREWFKIHFLEH